MTLPSSGSIAFSQVDTELGRSALATINLGAANVRTLAGVASGPIAMSSLRGKSNAPPVVPGPIASPYALVAAGSNAPLTKKYNFSSSAITAGTNLTTSKGNSAGTGNTVVGLFAGGNWGPKLNVVDKYAYATDAASAGTVLASARDFMGAVGNSYVAIFDTGTAAVPITDKYTYYGDSRVAGTALTGPARQGTGAVGTASIGIFAGGYSVTAISTKYTYSGDTVIAGTNLTKARTWTVTSGNTTVGYFCAGYTGNFNDPAFVDKYTYSNGSLVPGTNMGVEVYNTAMAGNITFGLRFGGYAYLSGGAINSTSKYTFSTDAVTAGTSFAYGNSGDYHNCATSAAPGGF